MEEEGLKRDLAEKKKVKIHTDADINVLAVSSSFFSSSYIPERCALPLMWMRQTEINVK